MQRSLSSTDYEAIAELRYQIRRYLRFSEEVSRAGGLEPRQYQLMLALKGLPQGTRPRIGELAERLQIQHHSTVELVNRLMSGGYVRRYQEGSDQREVLVALTPKGEQVLRKLFLHHRSELRQRGPALIAALRRAMNVSKGSIGANSPASLKKTKVAE
jgi:DNA-binding MarR family transcriptional regulator